MNLKETLSLIKREAILLKEKSGEEIELEISQIRQKIQLENKKEKNKPFTNLYSSFLSPILPKWFALVQEISWRTLGLKHFDTQLKAGWFLHQGKIVEMKTGEGKTLSSTLPVSFNALSEEGVHVVTINDYLAERDQKWMGKIYHQLGLTSGLVKSNSTRKEKQKSYASDITYLTNSELVFDYLRDSSVLEFDEIVQRPFSYCILDEIDSILIDEARTPLILSSTEGYINKKRLFLANAFARYLEKNIDFEIQEKQRDLFLTEEGYRKIIKVLGKIDPFAIKNPCILEILNALKALYFFKENKDYIILNNKVVIIDEFTGRVMEDRRWNLGIHEAIEIKENIVVGERTKTKSSITYQNFFKLYPKLAGMTGTAKTVEIEFNDLYDLEVVVVETNKPTIRKDYSDNIYQSQLAKWKAVLEQSKICFETGQPLLIGTANVEKSEFLSSLFQSAQIPHQVLNAKPENLARENEIIAQAGKKYAVTIATNMAGRGTDIVLGGSFLFEIKEQLQNLFFIKENENLHKNFSFEKWVSQIEKIKDIYQTKKTLAQLKKDIQNLPYSLETCDIIFKSFYEEFSQQFFSKWQKDNQEIKDKGGLFVLGTERHESRRIDNQLRGRAGRQGDPGISYFFVSLEDDLLKIFGGINIQKWIESFLSDKDEPLESALLTKSLENAQQKVEAYNYEIRKNVYEYEAVLTRQRKKLFRARYQLLCENVFSIFSFLEAEFSSCLEKNKKDQTKQTKKAFYGDYKIKKRKNLKKNINFEDLWITMDLRLKESNFYEVGLLKQICLQDVLCILDEKWTQHLERTTYIRETITWRSYGQQKPLEEYNLETIQSFQFMFQQIRFSVLYSFLNSSLLTK